MGSCISAPSPHASYAKMWEVEDLDNLPLCRIGRGGPCVLEPDQKSPGYNWCTRCCNLYIVRDQSQNLYRYPMYGGQYYEPEED